uniref:twin-arginine translocation signal domain-containing protein n=1 Tax=Halomonas sp. TaxID=1486246 RepID=UPI003562447E
MSDDKTNTPKNIERRHFLRNTGVVGVAGAGLAGGFGSAAALLQSQKAHAASKNGE